MLQSCRRRPRLYSRAATVLSTGRACHRDHRGAAAERATPMLATALIPLLLVLNAAVSVTPATTWKHSFQVAPQSVTRLCRTKSLISVNNLFPGPTIYANQGDTVLVNVTNNSPYNLTIHWHGIRQIGSAWADGPVYITQCPIQTGQSYVYNFTINRQRGSLFWHAHDTWLRATVHGAIVVYPTKGQPYPFRFPREEHVLLLGEWWHKNVEEIESDSLISGGAPDLSDAYMINGLPGPLYPCSAQDVYVMKVIPGELYLLRIVNAGLNQQLFFSVAGHNLTVVEIDGDYTKPLDVETVLLSPGQSTTVLLHANQPAGKYYMGASPYVSTGPFFPFPRTPALAILEYASSKDQLKEEPPMMPRFPEAHDTAFASFFTGSLRALADITKAEHVPQTVDRSIFFTVGLGLKGCNENRNCAGPNGYKLTAAINNNSFVLPDVALLQAYYYNISGVFTTDFPDKPPNPFDYTGTSLVPLSKLVPNRGTRVLAIPFNSNVQIVFQDTSILGTENHPIHVHGYSFYIVGQGVGNYNESTDPSSFNLFDPPRRNTVGVPAGGWAAIRFKADNPGVWYIHCHLEVHTTWGLTTAILVYNGAAANETLPPPPADLPQC